MKMSLCNTFRLFAVFTTIILCIAGSPVPGPASHQQNVTRGEITQDLERQESITLELKNDIKRPNDISSLKSNNAKDDAYSTSVNAESIKKNGNSSHVAARTEKAHDVLSKIVSATNINPQESEDTNTNIANVVMSNNEIQNRSNFENNFTINENQTEVVLTIESEHSTQAPILNTEQESIMNTKIELETTLPVIYKEKSIKPMTSRSSSLSEITRPTTKQYMVIKRKGVTITDEPYVSTDSSMDNVENLVTIISQLPTTITDTSGVTIKSELTQGRISLQDAITSDIPSLEKLKSDLLSFPKFTGKNYNVSITPLSLLQESNTDIDMTPFITTTLASTFDSEPLNTVSSKRAGYLDLSLINITIAEGVNLNSNDTESLTRPSSPEIPDIQDKLPEDKAARREESQGQVAEGAIKEDLLQEEIISDKDESRERHRDDRKQIVKEITTVLTDPGRANITQFDDKLIQTPQTVLDDNLSVKPIISDKMKNTVLYPVNPNYKPLKKIEVQPAKTFVRDPDDNSWRNESLSSLGIVFKPKNSSKPFTQVLKNKTETEWNNLSDKDIKNEVPDLRVRLEQIAQKRKSKKKKIDSFGNVFYTDYEENSSSEEHTSTQIVKELSLDNISSTIVSTTSAVTIVTPVYPTSLENSTAPVSDVNDVPTFTITTPPSEKLQTTSKKVPAKVTTLKPPNRFNLFDYYEANDDEDIADYLNLAKIDLKKYSVPVHTTFTSYTSPPLPVLFTNQMTPYTQERKGTIEYFPPRTTKRPRKNKHNYNGKKMEGHAFIDSAKSGIPMSYHKLTTPYDSNIYYTNSPGMTTVKDESVPKNFDRNLYLTTPPLTTLPDDEFADVGHGGYNRPSYVIKQYKEYMNDAPELGRGKHREYAFTEPPRHEITLADFVKPTTVHDKTTVTEDYDYETLFRKDLLDKFVANFNEKTNRFKSDFPVVYNNSIVHGAAYDEKDVAMSRAYFRRPYTNQEYKPLARDPYDPNCDNVTVELSPAYELHYYVPEQEEKQEAEPKPISLPVGYRL